MQAPSTSLSGQQLQRSLSAVEGSVHLRDAAVEVFGGLVVRMHDTISTLSCLLCQQYVMELKRTGVPEQHFCAIPMVYTSLH